MGGGYRVGLAGWEPVMEELLVTDIVRPWHLILCIPQVLGEIWAVACRMNLLTVLDGVKDKR